MATINQTATIKLAGFYPHHCPVVESNQISVFIHHIACTNDHTPTDSFCQVSNRTSNPVQVVFTCAGDPTEADIMAAMCYEIQGDEYNAYAKMINLQRADRLNSIHWLEEYNSEEKYRELRILHTSFEDYKAHNECRIQCTRNTMVTPIERVFQVGEAVGDGFVIVRGYIGITLFPLSMYEKSDPKYKDLDIRYLKVDAPAG